MPDRIIKESICTSDTLDRLSWFEEVLFYRLTVNCDDYGRFDARPAVLKSRLFPLKGDLTLQTITKALNRLEKTGLVMTYLCDDKPYLQILTWDKYQRVRAKRSKYPAPDSTCRQAPSYDDECPRNPIQSESKSNPNPREDTPAPAQRKAYGEYGWVKLTEEEYSRLLSDLGESELNRCITYIDESAQASGNKNHWRDWNLVIRKCHRDGWGIKKQAYQRRDTGFETSNPFLEMLKEGQFDDETRGR